MFNNKTLLAPKTFLALCALGIVGATANAAAPAGDGKKDRQERSDPDEKRSEDKEKPKYGPVLKVKPKGVQEGDCAEQGDARDVKRGKEDEGEPNAGIEPDEIDHDNAQKKGGKENDNLTLKRGGTARKAEDDKATKPACPQEGGSDGLDRDLIRRKA